MIRSAFSLKKLILRHSIIHCSKFSHGTPYFSYETIQTKGSNVLQLSLHNHPVNVLTTPFMQSLTAFFKQIQDRTVPADAVIIKSSIPNIFSAGLDLHALTIQNESDVNNFRFYWSAFQSLLLSLYGLDLPVLSLIEGDCLAAGCIIVLCTDYRIMTDESYKIGIAGTRVGISPPFWVCKLLSRVIGESQADRAIQLGTLFSPKEALKIQFVDQVVSPQESQAAVLSMSERFLSVDTLARKSVKLKFRKELIGELETHFEFHTDEFIEVLTSESTQKLIQKLLKKFDN